MYGSLPKFEKTFDFSETGETTGYKYEGTFTVRCVLNMAQRHGMELERTRLLADYKNPSADLAFIAGTLSECRARVIDGPSWWKDKLGADLVDEEIVFTLANKCYDAETQWKAQLKVKAEEAVSKNV